MLFALILAASQLPIVVLYSYIYFRDQKGREPLWLLFKTFFVGALACIPAAFLEQWADIQTVPGPTVGAITLLASAFLVGLIEEGLKYAALRYYPYRKKEFDEPYDGIMYSVSISLGFAAFENFVYVLIFGLGTAVVRMFTAVPMHAMTAVLMGYEIGRAKFALSPSERDRFLRRALWIPLALHALYDFFLFLHSPATSMLALVVLAYQFRITKSAMREFAMHVPGRTEGIILTPAPPAPSAVAPKNLGLATGGLWITFILWIGAAALVGFAVSAGQLDTARNEEMAWAFLAAAAVAIPSLVVMIRRLRKGSRFAWVLSLAVFVVYLGTPGFIVGILGLNGLLNERSREFFWTQRAEPLPAT